MERSDRIHVSLIDCWETWQKSRNCDLLFLPSVVQSWTVQTIVKTDQLERLELVYRGCVGKSVKNSNRCSTVSWLTTVGTGRLSRGCYQWLIEQCAFLGRPGIQYVRYGWLYGFSCNRNERMRLFGYMLVTSRMNMRPEGLHVQRFMLPAGRAE